MSREELVWNLESRWLRLSGAVSVLGERLVQALRGRPIPKMMSHGEESAKGETPQVGPSQPGPTRSEFNFSPTLFTNPSIRPMKVVQKWGIQFFSHKMSVGDFILLLEERSERYGLS
jgi:hypothetical protein